MSFEEGFWTEKYLNEDTGWDIGYASTPLKTYFDQLRNTDLKILIPGCGNAYEAKYLLENGFTNLHLLDISNFLVKQLKTEFYPTYQDRISIYCEDFFNHKGTYDLILEQTFFCSLQPSYRLTYARKMYELLKDKGRLIGVLFTFPLTKEGPPFGGDIEEYKQYFNPYFNILSIEACKNSIAPRMGNECFMILEKRS